MILEQIISGGQTGADIAGLKAAKACNIKTGGWATKSFRTLDGNRPQYAELYGMKPAATDNYKDRTWKNVEDSDATMRFATSFGSYGELCTKNALTKYKKPFLDIDLHDVSVTIEDMVKFLLDHNVKILNVAGNSEQTSPGIETTVFNILFALFQHLGSV